MSGISAPALVVGDQGMVASEELMRASAALVAAAAEQGWYAAEWDHDDRDLVVVDAPAGPCRTRHRLRIGPHGRLDELRDGKDWVSVDGTDALRALAACLGRTDLVLLTPRMGPAHRYRVDADVSPRSPVTQAVTALFFCPPAPETRP